MPNDPNYSFVSLGLDPSQPTTILKNAGASVTGIAYGVPQVGTITGTPQQLIVQLTGTPGTASFIQGSLDGVTFVNLGVALVAGIQTIANPPSLIKAVTGASAVGVTVTVQLVE